MRDRGGALLKFIQWFSARHVARQAAPLKVTLVLDVGLPGE